MDYLIYLSLAYAVIGVSINVYFTALHYQISGEWIGWIAFIGSSILSALVWPVILIGISDQ